MELILVDTETISTSHAMVVEIRLSMDNIGDFGVAQRPDAEIVYFVSQVRLELVSVGGIESFGRNLSCLVY